MAFLIRPGKRLKKKKSGNAEEILAKLDSYLKEDAAVPEEILCGFWKDQQDAITYQELREAVMAGALNESTFWLWRQDYSVLVAEKLKSVWEKAMFAGAANQPIMSKLSFALNMQTSGIRNWIQERGAEFVTRSTAEQKNAIAALLSKKMVEGHTVDELARLIRPCIGLTEGQAKANARYYDSIVENLKKEHPRMKPESIQRKAQDAAMKYAERQHRQRAMTIAMTESAFAYNRGADEGIRQAQAQGLLGAVKKRWCTSGDDQVCSICQGLEGVELGMDDGFEFKGRQLFAGQNLMPPAHPRCACAVEYIEVEAPAFVDMPQMDVSITENDSFREYTDEEINSIAAQTEAVLSNHIDIPSKWSGGIVIDDEGIENTSGNVIHYGKLWNCDILTAHETAPAIIMHEQIHARSISYCEPIEFYQCQRIEEASVQLLTEEICKKEGIEIIASEYDDILLPLRKIGYRIQGNDNLYEFSKELLSIKPTERMEWLSNKLYAILGQDLMATLEEYHTMSVLLDLLY